MLICPDQSAIQGRVAMDLFHRVRASPRLGPRLLLALGLMLAAPATGGVAGESGDKPTVRELSAAWWQWALSILASVNPLGDPTGVLCGVGQHGGVWFLGGTLDVSSPAERSCKVPAGTAIFFPVINAECSVIEDSSLQDRAALRACAKGFMDLVTAADAEVDGRPVKVVRARSALFAITLPPGDVLGIVGNPDKSQTPNPSPAVADGFWVLLERLPIGEHSITYEGKLVFPDQSTFEQRIDYSIEVVLPSFGDAAAVPSGEIPPTVVPSPTG
jgi:hypothetical protein